MPKGWGTEANPNRTTTSGSARMTPRVDCSNCTPLSAARSLLTGRISLDAGALICGHNGVLPIGQGGV